MGIIDDREKRWVTNVVIPQLKSAEFDVQKHEDKFSSGIPDLSFGKNSHNGWIEVKVINGRTPSGLFRIDNLIPEQKNWLRKRGKKGGRCWLMVRTDDGVFLIHWSIVRNVGAESTTWFMSNNYCFYFAGTDRWDDITLILDRHN